MTMILLILALLVLVGLIAYAGARFTETNTTPLASLPSVKDADGRRVHTEESDSFTITAIYPDSTPLAADANTHAVRAIEAKITTIISDFKRSVAEYPPEAGRTLALDIEYSSFASPGYVSYLFEFYEDTGGAHPNTGFATLVFRDDGSVVTFDSFFMPGSRYLDLLSEQARLALAAQLKERTGSSEFDTSYLETGTAPDAENFQHFVLDGESMLFFIPPYQIAPYVVGEFQFKIPLASLEAFRAR